MKVLDDELQRRLTFAKHARSAGFTTTALLADKRAEDFGHALAAIRDLIRASGDSNHAAKLKEYIECT